MMSSVVFATIKGFGSASLMQGGDNYFLQSNGGWAVEPSYARAPAVDRQFDPGSHWVPIGGEQTACEYEVAWKVTHADQYAVWYADNSGAYLSDAYDVDLGTNAASESSGSSVRQDLGDDGKIDPPPKDPTAEIEASGSTRLVETGSIYFLEPSGRSEVEPSYAEAPVGAVQFDQSDGPWAPIGTDQTANHEAAWKTAGADQFAIWNTANSGNFLSSAPKVASVSSAALASPESSLQQDLNNDVSNGPSPTTPAIVIETSGSTSLVETGSNYFLQPNGGAEVELSYAGSPVVDGQFDQFGGHWVPIGAEQTASGYEVAWKVAGADEYTVWYTDNSGDYLSSAFDVASGTSATLEAFETSFQQDLNGDGVIGPSPAAPTTVIEAFGSTSLVETGVNYFLQPNGGAEVELSYTGSPVVAGQFGAWTPIGTEQTASGYEVAWKMTGTDQYTVWNVDNNGNYLSSAFDTASGTSVELESFEASFHQDLNGDGVIGPATVIEAFGSTSLVQGGSNYFIDANGEAAVELSYAGAPVTAGQFGAWTPIGAEQTASGYEVAWKMTGTDQYTVWNIDNNGNYLSSAFVTASGTSAELESFETSFQQDLNGDGVIGPPSATSSPQFVYEGLDAEGAQLYSVTWDVLGSHPFEVRVLAPTDPSTDYAHNFLFALPVEGGLDQSTFGSGLDELQKLDVQDQYNATIIEPIFPIDSWYADNPTDATIDFETFTAVFLPEWVDSNFATTGTEKNLLIGFSKSGYGALDLLLKHPAVFDGAAAFDFPADMAAYDDFGSSSSDDYGTDANFQDNYRLTGAFIDAWKAPFTTEDHILISEGPVFGDQVADFNALLTSHGVEDTLLTTQTSDAHSWSGGWLPDAVAGLYGLETDLHQTVIETFGSTSLVEDGSNYFLQPNGGLAVELSYAGAPVVEGQFDQSSGPFRPIGAEQTATGYEVAWKMIGADEYTIWNTDSSGNYVSSAFDVASGTSAALESFETSFHQDLNGDGVIGPPPAASTTVIEASGSTTLVESGDNYILQPNGGAAVELSYGEAPVVDGQFDQFGGHWVPIGAEQTASGYEVAWKIAGADQYTIWNTDNSGNYLSSAFDTASGTSAALESFETSFNQDLNGDGYIGPVLNGSSGGQTLTAGAGPTTLIGGPNDTLIGGAGADTFVFAPNFGAEAVNNFKPSTDTLQFSESTFATAAAVLNNAHQVGSDVAITDASADLVTLHNVQLASLHASDFHIV
jgi:hypothetical protein